MAIPRVIGAGARLLISPLQRLMGSGVENQAARVIQAEATDPLALMTAQPSAVPGVQRTLAEESLDAGIARLERLARAQGQGFDQLDRTNNAARVAALRTFAQDDAALAAAEQARHAASNGLRQRAMRAPPVDTSRLVSQIGRLEAAQQGRPAVQAGLAQVRKLLEAPEGMEGLSMPVLYNVRKTLGDMLSGKFGGDTAAALAGSRELLAIRGQLDRVMAKNSPEFAQYLDAFRRGSEPINRMQIGQQLIGQKSGQAVMDPVTGEQVLLPAAFSSQARNLDRVAQQATGFRKATADRALRPEDQATIAAVRDDLERRAFAATAGSGGNSHTFERLAQNDRIGGQLLSKVPVLGAAIGELQRMGQARLNRKLAEVLANPAEARRILAALPAADRRAIEDAIARASAMGGNVVTARSVAPEQVVLQPALGQQPPQNARQ